MLRRAGQFALYWLLTVLGQLASVSGLIVGAIAGAFLFSLVFQFPPQSGLPGLVLIGSSAWAGIYAAKQVGKRSANVVRRITERIERGHSAPPVHP